MRELKYRLDGARRRLEREHDERAWLVWHVAALMPWTGRRRNPKLPKLKTMLAKSSAQAKEPQSWRKQMMIMDLWVHATRHFPKSRNSVS